MLGFGSLSHPSEGRAIEFHHLPTKETRIFESSLPSSSRPQDDKSDQIDLRPFRKTGADLKMNWDSFSHTMDGI